jgi:glycosyltransferase involved in cell wall biosynthesis
MRTDGLKLGKNTGSSDGVRFTIVTVCYNSARTIVDTIQSVNIQDYGGFVEHVFVDGGSKDSTLELIRSHSARCPRWISGPDKGIYDAMNKGVAISNGDWLFFLNSDDSFRTGDVLRQVACRITKDPELELVHGKTVELRDGRVRNLRGRPLLPSDRWYPMRCMGHQGVFCRKELFARIGPFEVGLVGGISDFAWLARYFQSAHPSRYAFLDLEMANFAEGGYSFEHAWEAHVAELGWVRRNMPLAVFLRHLSRTPKVFLLVKILKVQRETRLKKLFRSFRGALGSARG